MAERTKTEIALENCRMLAAREIRRHDVGKASTVLTYAAWKHVLRFCEEGGVTGSILRDVSAGSSSLVADPNDLPRKSKRRQSLDEIEAARDMKADMYGENGNG